MSFLHGFRNTWTLPLVLLLVGCNAPARQGPSTVRQANAPAQGPATAISQEPLSSTASPTGEPSEAAAAPTSEPAPEATPAPTSVQFASGSSQVVYQIGTYELKGYLCVPEGEAPFPAVVYNHGGLGDQIGGAPAETCGALARDGFVGFSPIRRPTASLQEHLDDVFAGVDYVKGLGYVDPDRLAVMGFSRGGMVDVHGRDGKAKRFQGHRHHGRFGEDP
ncbi:MAG: prolyl oligopeptidase family serine peptidase [Anaerolineales bacterium]